MNDVKNFITTYRTCGEMDCLIASISEQCTGHNGICFNRYKQIYDYLEKLTKEKNNIIMNDKSVIETIGDKSICSHWIVGKDVFTTQTTYTHEINIYNDVHSDMRVSIQYEKRLAIKEIISEPLFIRMRQSWTFRYDERIEYILHKVAIAPSKETLHLASYTYNVDIKIPKKTEYFNYNDDLYLTKSLVLKALDLDFDLNKF